MNAEARELVRTARDQKARERIFTTDSTGRVVLKPVYKDGYVPSVPSIVHGINHSTWGYREHGCRCSICTDAMNAVQRRRRQRNKTAAHGATPDREAVGGRQGEA